MDANVVRDLVDDLEAEVNTGGFDAYFFNSAGDRAGDVIVALTKIGATRTAGIVRRACARFPGGMPPVERFSRQELLLGSVSIDGLAFAQDDADFLAYEEDLATLVDAYAARRGP